MAYTLGYWNIRGLAQPIRFLLAHLSIEYNDKQYSDFDDWFKVDKKTLKSEFPNIPYFIDGECIITESSAIPLYIIKKHNRPELLGQTIDGTFSEKEVRIQQILGVTRDIQKALFPILFNPDFINIKEKTFTDTLVPYVEKIEKFLGDNEWLVGTLSYADFVFYELLNYYKHIFPASITETLAAYILRFENLHGVKEIIAKNEGILTVFMPKGHAIWSGPSA